MGMEAGGLLQGQLVEILEDVFGGAARVVPIADGAEESACTEEALVPLSALRAVNCWRCAAWVRKLPHPEFVPPLPDAEPPKPDSSNKKASGGTGRYLSQYQGVDREECVRTALNSLFGRRSTEELLDHLYAAQRFLH